MYFNPYRLYSPVLLLCVLLELRLINVTCYGYKFKSIQKKEKKYIGIVCILQ